MISPDQIGSGLRTGQGGFSLVEVVISAAILGLVVAGLTSLLATGRALDSSSRLRSQAMALASNSLNRTTNHYTAYPVAAGVTSTARTLKTESDAACAATQIDSVYAPVPDYWVDATSGTAGAVEVPYQKITSMVVWNCGGLADTVILRKRIADVGL